MGPHLCQQKMLKLIYLFCFILFCFCVLAILPTNWTSLACEFTVSRHVEDLYDVLVVGFWSPLHEDVAKTVTLTPKRS